MTRKKAEKARENGGSKDNVEERAESLINEANALLTYKEPEGNRQKGIAFLQEAIELGSVKAMYRLGQVYENGGIISTDRGKSIELYTLAAENHHEDAIIALAKLYYNDETIEDHYNLAMKVIDKYLVLFNGEANYLKGLMLWNGQGVEINARMAIGHMTFAAMTGHMKAAAFLGNVYENGHKADLRFDTYDPRQVEPNQCNAAHFYEIAAVKGDRNSKYKLALMKLHGRGTNHDYRGAFYYLWHAANADLGAAQLELARFYISELLFPKDITAAMFWALMSQNYEYNPQASEFINELKTKLKKAAFVKLQQEVLDHKNTKNKDKKAIPNYLLLPDRYLELYGFTADEDTTPAIPETKDTDICPPEETTPKTNDDKGAQGNNQVPFVITDIKKLAITIYTNSDKVKLAYEDKHITLEAAKVLSPNCKELLLRHDKHLNHHERAVSYYDSDIYDAQNSSERSNHQIVADFNYAFRKFFDLDKKIKPFKWIGKKADRSLKANFTLKVDYKPKKQGKPQST